MVEGRMGVCPSAQGFCDGCHTGAGRGTADGDTSCRGRWGRIFEVPHSYHLAFGWMFLQDRFPVKIIVP
jgi:hypothetical protein